MKNSKNHVTFFKISEEGQKSIITCRSTVKGSLILALLVSSFALFVVLALSTLSSININMVRTQVEYNQAFISAQAAAAQFIYELDTLNYLHNNEVDISSVSKPMDLKTRYNLYPVFFTGTRYVGKNVNITFDQSRPYYSTDNLASENSAVGWKDKGRNTNSVPPFSIDLIINVKIGGSERHFEAVINRLWPYAAFCENGPIAITSPEFNLLNLSYPPSIITGNIFSFSSVLLGLPDSNDRNNKVIGNICTALSKPEWVHDNLRSLDPLYVYQGNTLKGKKCYTILKGLFLNTKTPIESIRFPDKNGFKELQLEQMPEFEVVGSAVDSTLSLLNGTFTWTGSKEKEIKFREIVASFYETALSNPSELSQEMQHYIDSFILQAPVKPNLSKSYLTYLAVADYVKETYFGKSVFMKKDFIIEGTDECSKYAITGNLSNHYVKYKRSENAGVQLFIGNNKPLLEGFDNDSELYSKAGLILKNCTLYIDGDVELCESYYAETPQTQMEKSDVEKFSSIEGDNATLIVSGNLRIEGGNLDSKDKGMVMLAKNIEFSTKGTFKGVIISKGLIVFNPYKYINLSNPQCKQEKLVIQGAIASYGIKSNNSWIASSKRAYSNGMVLRGIDLTYNPRYAKMLHQFGQAGVMSWQELK
ncbi:MAG: hypothetical protein AB2L14_31785 [Candidatus Xenobiia bacterium LiM19]